MYVVLRRDTDRTSYSFGNIIFQRAIPQFDVVRCCVVDDQNKIKM